MSTGPFVRVSNEEDRDIFIHHSAIVCVEELEDGCKLVLRIGNNKEIYITQDTTGEVMEELRVARRAEIVSFGE